MSTWWSTHKTKKYLHPIRIDNPVLCLPPQGSLDNISIILVCFPGAPKVSQEALKQEAALEQHIDMKVEGELLQTSTLTFGADVVSQIIYIIHTFWLNPFTEIIQMMRSKDEDPDLLYVIKFLAAEEMPGLPPGGGITSKWVWTINPHNPKEGLWRIQWRGIKGEIL